MKVEAISRNAEAREQARILAGKQGRDRNIQLRKRTSRQESSTFFWQEREQLRKEEVGRSSQPCLSASINVVIAAPASWLLRSTWCMRVPIDISHSAATSSRTAARRFGAEALSLASVAPMAAKRMESLNESVFEESRVESLRNHFLSAEPYSHVQIHNLCNDSSARKVHEEAVHNLTADFKETDLFKVFQSGDLSEVEQRDSELTSKIPSLLQFRNELFSNRFRQLVESITQCGALSERIDMSANAYTQGGHLLCHDDVIGTRRVAFIAYFSDPDDTWAVSDGGALELYPQLSSQTTEPSTKPSKCLLPTFNSLVLFNVVPGKSFHSIQEVFTGDKPRLSISGWFHAPEAPEGAHTDATLSQLTQRGQDVASVPFGQISPPESSGSGEEPLDDCTLRYLRSFINNTFLEESEINRINEALCNEQSVQLNDFLRQDFVNGVTGSGDQHSVQDCIHAADQDAHLGVQYGSKPPSYDAGVKNGWREVGPPHKMRYLRLESLASNNQLAAWLTRISNDLLQSRAFAAYLRRLTGGHRVNGVASEVRRFRPGLDYTVAQKGSIAVSECVDATLCFVDSSSNETAGTWKSGEVGGFECYLEAADENDEHAEVYSVEADDTAEEDHDHNNDGDVEDSRHNHQDSSNDRQQEQQEAEQQQQKHAGGSDEKEQGQSKEGGDTSQLLSVHPASNTLSLVHRKEGIMRFVKYVSAQAPSSRYDICAQYTLEEDDDDDGDRDNDTEQ